ncbi:MAG: dihydrolipoyl dehydrogenase family protein, partial [Pirellulaceae bacterium]
ATGSVPAMPPSFQIGSDRVMDSTGALALTDIPKRLLVVGGGYIGLEMGTVYANLGSQVTVVEWTDGLLPGADRDLVKPLHKHLEKLFDKRIYLNTKVGSMAEVDNQVEVTFEGPGKYGHERFDRVLVSVGRRPVSAGLGLEKTSVQVNPRGFVVCDKQQRTSDPHILAIGDVAGDPMLAHKASHEAKVAVEVVMGKPVSFDKQAIPAVVFTDPEIAWAGLTEDQAKREGRQVDVEVYPWAASGRAQALGRTEGLTKWLVDPQTHRVLGCGIVGSGAGELIAEAVLAIEMGCEVRDLTESIHPHPTLSETLMNAGEVHFGTATEIYKPKKSHS